MFDPKNQLQSRFGNIITVRRVLESDFQDKANADREAVLQLISGGVSHPEAVARFNTDDNFGKWLEAITARLSEAVE